MFLPAQLADKEYLGRGGEATIYTAFLVPANPDKGLSQHQVVPFVQSGTVVAQKVKVAVRDVQLPEGRHDWTSFTGRRIRQQVQREVLTHLQLNHPNILPLLGVVCDRKVEGCPLSMVTPFAEGGNALDYLRGNRASKPRSFFEIVS